MKNPTGTLLLLLTIMISIVSLIINLGSMLYGEALSPINTLASLLYLLLWAALAVYSMTNHGIFSFFICLYWFSALAGATFCVITISGMTQILELSAYALLFVLTPLFGLRILPITHLLWAVVLAGLSGCFVVAGLVASSRRSAQNEEAPLMAPLSMQDSTPDRVLGE